MNAKLDFVNCNLCGIDDTQQLFEKNQCNIVKCKRCGLIYINPRLNQNAVKEIYGGNYSAGWLEHKKTISKRKRAKKILKRIMKVKKNGKFLDVGCSVGYILEAAREKGFEPYGVEISPIAINFAKKELELNVFEGYLEDANFSNNFFDVITMYNLLEHIPNPSGLIQETSKILKPDGVIEIWTPNIGHRLAKRLGSDWPAIMHDHLYYFNLVTMDKILEKNGLYIYKNQFTIKDSLKIYAKKK